MKLNPMAKRVATYLCDLIYFVICFLIVFAVVMSIYFYIDRLISDEGKLELPLNMIMMLVFVIGLSFMLMGFFLGRAVKAGDCTIYDVTRRMDDPAELSSTYVTVILFAKDKGWLKYLVDKDPVLKDGKAIKQ